MKHLLLVLTVFFTLSLFTGCGGPKRARLPQGASPDIAVLSLGADTSSLNQDQVALLNQTLKWMDRDIIQGLKRSGMQPTRITSEDEFSGRGMLLKVSITNHKMIPKGARFLGGMMAGADVLGAHFDLLDQSKRVVLSWDDTQASTRGGTHAAQTLNRNTIDRIVNHLSAS
jgi:hypothetical protein